MSLVINWDDTFDAVGNTFGIKDVNRTAGWYWYDGLFISGMSKHF